MIQDKRRLQLYTSLALSVLVVGLGLLSAYSAIGLFRAALERQLAEDGEIIGENLRIIARQVSQGYTDREGGIAEIQSVLEALQEKGWIGFACVLDKNGRVLAHPRPEMVGLHAPLHTYEPTDLLGSQSPPVEGLQLLPNRDTVGVYRTAPHIVAVRWLPQIMTYLCVHQSVRPLDERLSRLRRVLAMIGFGFVVAAAVASWFFVGKLVDRYESHLARSEARNRVLVENSTPLLVVDASGVILDGNPQAETLFGSPCGKLLGTRLEDLCPPGSSGGLAGLLKRVRDSGVVEWSGIDVRSIDGRTIPADVRACRIDYGDREATYLLIRDTSESRRAREEILEANRRLRELDRLKTDFLNTVSHELRTPLTSIRWSVESLETLVDRGGDENVEKLLDIIRDDNHRLSGLIEQILSFSQLDAGKLRPHLQSVDLSSALDRAMGELAVAAGRKGVEMASDIKPGITVQADADQLHRALTNVLDNAVKYTPQGGDVHLSARPEEGQACVVVRDTGLGIAEGDLARVFEGFYRADDPAARQERGTGLGLAIVKGIVEAHNGSVQIKSAAGSGTSLTIRLPLAASPPEVT